MSSRRRGSTPAKPHQEPVLYQKVRSSAVEDENGAPEYIYVPVEQASRQAATPDAPRRRAKSTPGKPYRTPRHRTPTPPPREEESSQSFRTPPRRSIPNNHGRIGSVTPKEMYGDESDDESVFYEDGRGSPEERRRKRALANNLPRRLDGKFASTKKKTRRPAEEDGYQSEQDVSDHENDAESFRGNSKRKYKLTTPPLPYHHRFPERRSPVLVPFDDDYLSSDGEESKAVAPRPPKRVVDLQFGSKKDGRYESDSSSSSRSGDSFDGITEYHKTINNTTNVVVISDSSIGTQSSRSSDGEE